MSYGTDQFLAKQKLERRRKQCCEATRRHRVKFPPDRQKRNIANRTKYKANPAKHREQRYSWVQRNPEKYLWSNARIRAQKQGLSFTIKPADILVPKRCPYLGIFLQLGGPAHNSPSLDRIDNRKGYTPANIEVISQRANLAKSNLKPREALRMAQAFIRRFSHFNP